MKKNLQWLAGIIIFTTIGFSSCEKKTPIDIKTESEIAIAKSPSSPKPPNDNCANAINLTPGDTLFNQTTAGATKQTGEVVNSSCLTGGLGETVWYKFTAISPAMYVDAEVTNDLGFNCIGDFNFVVVVYNTATCVPGSSAMINCQRMGNDLVVVHELNGLTVGNIYLVQAGYRKTSPGCTISPIFKIVVGNTEPSCASCSTTCGVACEFLTTPLSGSYVKANCTGDQLIPRLQGNSNGNLVSRTFCYTFTAANTTVGWGLVRESNDNFYSSIAWQLQVSTCSGVIQSGIATWEETKDLLVKGQLTNLTIGTQYTMCFTLTPNWGTWVSKIWPFFVGADSTP